MTGEVIFYNPKLCFGFIKTEDESTYFVHKTGIAPGTKLFKRNKVSFELSQHDGRGVAVNVTRI